MSSGSPLPTFDADGCHANPVESWNDDAHTAAVLAENRQRIPDCIDQLPESYRTVLMLRDIEELDTEEAAQALNCTIRNVKTRLHRARQALKTLLDPMFAC